MKWTLQRFLHGQKFAFRYGRKCLPVLVSRAEQYKGVPQADIPDFTYGDLAAMVADRKYAHPMHYALGSIGYALRDLNTRPEWKAREIPPIQLMVWSEGRGSPGDDAFSFIGISKEQARQMPEPARRATATNVRARIVAYPHWREVLTALSLEPLTLRLPAAEEVADGTDRDWTGGAESIHHKRLKLYLAEHYDLLSLEGDFLQYFEVCLPSGDRMDLLLEEAAHVQRICIEVKSRISNDEDLIRGIFQCVKYRAILDAQQRYELKRNKDHAPMSLRVFLATECALSGEIKELSDFFAVPVFRVRVPDEYEPHKPEAAGT